jgi:hypothetical protein
MNPISLQELVDTPTFEDLLTDHKAGEATLFTLEESLLSYCADPERYFVYEEAIIEKFQRYIGNIQKFWLATVSLIDSGYNSLLKITQRDREYLNHNKLRIAQNLHSYEITVEVDAYFKGMETITQLMKLYSSVATTIIQYQQSILHITNANQNTDIIPKFLNISTHDGNSAERFHIALGRLLFKEDSPFIKGTKPKPVDLATAGISDIAILEKLLDKEICDNWLKIERCIKSKDIDTYIKKVDKDLLNSVKTNTAKSMISRLKTTITIHLTGSKIKDALSSILVLHKKALRVGRKVMQATVDQKI